MTALLVFFVTIFSPSGEHLQSDRPLLLNGSTAEAATHDEIRLLAGTWKVVRATVTPDFLSIPIPISTIDATGSIRHDRSYEIKASAALFGSSYAYLGKGTIELKGPTVILTVDEGTITVDERKKTIDRKGKIIRGTYRITADGTMFMKTVREKGGVRYTFDLELVNT